MQAMAEYSPIDVLIACSSHLMPPLRLGWYAIPLRLIVGFGFMEHGYAKLVRGPDSFADIRHACTIVAGMGNDPRRAFRRPGRPCRRLHSAREHSHGDRSPRRHLHRPPS